MANQASAASSSSATSCPASTSYSHYDVFINHRGPDVKYTFAVHLYRRLLEKGLRVFLDTPELLPGHPITPQIRAAIEVASVHIAIFSPRYAESPWCLEQLDFMVRAKERAANRAAILPVFYDVKPYDLRYTKKGAYAEALLNHEKKVRYDSNTIQNWRSALSYAAELNGFELDGDEEELLRNVVEGVLKYVSKPPLCVANYPTGLEDKLQDFEMTMLNEHKGRLTRAKVVGIVGFGGVGKTTLAKEFFNRNRSHYNESSFLLDVREKSARMSLNYLQTKLIEDLKHRNIKIESPDEGIEILKRDLSSCHALIILDDVDNASQLEMLMPVDVLSAESLILVTTRNKHVLVQSGVSSVYNMTGLNTSHSKELFCSYAFHRPLPPTKIEELVDRFVKACNGLPLSLKVIGALLCGENEQYWEDQLVRLGVTLPEDIQKTLRISYDSLCKEDQSIFLDIACFFLGGNRDRAIRIWGFVAIQNLENKCLLEEDSENNLRMHDHIRDCARSIAQEETMPLRLWYQTRTNVMDALLEKSSSVEIEVRGIATMAGAFISDDLHLYYGDYTRKESEIERLFNNSDFRGMKNLRYVATIGASLEAMLRRLHSPQLSWLRWYGCSCSSLPDWIPMKNLRVLDVQGNDMKSLWREQSQGPLKLRELRIFAPLSNFPKSIGQLDNLEWIHITAPRSHLMSKISTLETLPEEFCHLSSLKYLVLEEFSKLISLPHSFGKLTNLQHINLDGASSLQRLPDSFGNLIRLKYLRFSYCSKLTISNGALANIARLEYLNLVCCFQVKELPPRVVHQRSLKQLHLAGTNLKELPCGIGDLCNLEILDIGGHSLELLPSWLGNLKSLKHFSLRWSPKVKCLPDSFGMLTQLTDLYIQASGIEYLPQDLPKLNNLVRASVSACQLREVSFKRREGEPEISSLEISEVAFFNGVCPNLERLDVSSNRKLKSIAFFNGVCPNLENIDVSDCRELKSIQGLGQLTKLQSLSVGRCLAIESLNVNACDEIENLDVSGCSELKSIQGLGQLTKLQYLNVSHCSELKSIQGLGHLTKLQSLSVGGCLGIESLHVNACDEIENLDVSRCSELKSIQGLGQLTNLQQLDVSSSRKLKSIAFFNGVCPNLEYLNVSECSELKSIQGLGQLTKLEELNVNRCREIPGLPGVEHCLSLRYLGARDCPKLRWGRVLQQLRGRLKTGLDIDVKQYKRWKLIFCKLCCEQ